MFETIEWTELITAETVVWAAFFVSMFGPCVVALYYYIGQRLGPKKSR